MASNQTCLQNSRGLCSAIVLISLYFPISLPTFLSTCSQNKPHPFSRKKGSTSSQIFLLKIAWHTCRDITLGRSWGKSMLPPLGQKLRWSRQDCIASGLSPDHWRGCFKLLQYVQPQTCLVQDRVGIPTWMSVSEHGQHGNTVNYIHSLTISFLASFRRASNDQRIIILIFNSHAPKCTEPI